MACELEIIFKDAPGISKLVTRGKVKQGRERSDMGG